MSAALATKRCTPEEYLMLEVRSERKHEFYRGEIFLMAGGSPAHSIVKINLYGILRSFLVGKPCVLFDSDMRVKVSANGLYTYPDGSVACPPIEIENLQDAQTLTNPVVLFEVLSASTASYDRGGKFNLYRGLDSLKEYFLISQDAAVVERRYKRDDGEWSLNVADDLDSSITIESLGFELKLIELYDKVEFPPRIEE
jgi:Uma2 family endonuclease